MQATRRICLMLICFLGLGLYSWTCGASPSKSTIQIAAIFSLQGSAFQDGMTAMEGARWAIEEVNEDGGIHGVPLELIEFDDQSQMARSQVMAQQAVKQQPIAAIGGQWSSYALAMAPVFEEAQIPFISNIATQDQVTQIGNYIFRMCFTDSGQGAAISQFAIQYLNAKTAAIFVDTQSHYSESLANAFQKEFERLGGIVKKRQYYKRTRFDYQELLKPFKKEAPNVFFIPGHGESLYIMKAAQDLGISATFLGGDGWGGPPFFEKLEVTMGAGFYTAHWAVDSPIPASQEFVRTYGAQHHLSSSTALAYDSVHLIAQALRTSGASTPQELQQALYELETFSGVTGPTSFSQTGNPQKSVRIVRWNNGQHHTFKVLE